MRIQIAGLVLALAGLSLPPGPAAPPATAADPSRGSMLITPRELSRRLTDPHLVLLQVGAAGEFDRGHIPGARAFSLDLIDAGNDSLSLQLPDPARLDSVFGALGVRPDSRIVLYFGKDWVSPTTRVWFTLDYLGLGDRTAILDGGLPAWRAAGLPVTTDPTPAPVARRLTSRARPELVATAEQIQARLGDSKQLVLDARTPGFYSGLDAGMFPRPGHIHGAHNLSYQTVVGEDLLFRPDTALRRLFTAAGYTPGKSVVAYCHIGQQATAVYFAARLLGIPVRLYDGSFQEWSARRDLPVDRDVEPTHAALITTAELAARLEQGNVTVIDARGDLGAYLANHLPGAPYLHFESLRASRGGVPADTLGPEAYAGLLGRLGVRRDRPVVIYGSGDAGNFNATFLAWILSGFRQREVYVLDGGYAKWAAEGRPVTRAYPATEVTSYSADPYALDVAGVDWVSHMLKRPGIALVDVRPADQYAGTAGPQMRRGHIPGAVNHVWSSDLVDGGSGVKVWKPLEALRAGYESQGITPDKHIFVYCNTGTEASHVYFALHELLGYPYVRVYVPSWTDWAGREELPVEQGDGSARATGTVGP